MALDHILFDFFGTLVEYDDSWTSQGYPRTHAVLCDAGARLDYAAFLRVVEAVFLEHERAAEATLEEYTADRVCSELARRALGTTDPPAQLVHEVRDAYIAEWNKCVQPIEGVDAMLEALAARYRLAVVSNTLHGPVVPSRLEALGIARHFELVVTSVEHGKRKPSPCIFDATLERLGARAASTIHVGDSFVADYGGAVAAGIGCLLIDPDARHAVPEQARIRSVLEVPDVVRRGP